MMKAGGNETSNIEGDLAVNVAGSIGAMRQQEADEVSEVAHAHRPDESGKTHMTPPKASHSAFDLHQLLVQGRIAVVPMRWNKIAIAASAPQLMPCVTAPCGSIRAS
jgi:hypothetical protein